MEDFSDSDIHVLALCDNGRAPACDACHSSATGFTWLFNSTPAIPEDEVVYDLFDCLSLLRTESFNRIQIGSLSGGIVTKADANECGKENGNGDRVHADHGVPTGDT